MRANQMIECATCLRASYNSFGEYACCSHGAYRTKQVLNRGVGNVPCIDNASPVDVILVFLSLVSTSQLRNRSAYRNDLLHNNKSQ